MLDPKLHGALLKNEQDVHLLKDLRLWQEETTKVIKRMFLALMTIFGLVMGILINRKRKTLDILHRSAVLSIIFFVLGIVIAIIFGK